MASKKERVAAVSIVASGSLAAAKFTIGVMIGSLALISDALHSLIDLGATVVTWFAVRIADKPADEEHQYGHGKIESIAALAESALLFLLAGGVAVEAYQRLAEGTPPVPFSLIAFVVMGVEMAVNLWRARVLHRTARETHSEALAADALHFASDFYGSIAVVIGLVLSAYGMAWGDAAAALAVAALVALLGLRMGRRTIDTLVDKAPSGAAEKASDAVAAVDGVTEVERIRVRRVGPSHFVETSVRVPRTLPLDRLPELKSAVQDAVVGALGQADVTVTATPVALDDETVLERVMVIARNRGVAVHHVTVHAIDGRLTVALDIEVDGHLSLGAAHELADGLEARVAAELGPDVEVETHIEPLQASSLDGTEADAARVAAVRQRLEQLAASCGTVEDIHNVRVRTTEDGEIVNFHCRVDPQLTVQDVHERVDAVERGLRLQWPTIKRVIGHAEPIRAG